MSLFDHSDGGQMALAIQPTCKARGCHEPTVGSSISGEGHVCRGHNEREWGLALLKTKDNYYRQLGSQLVKDGANHAT